MQDEHHVEYKWMRLNFGAGTILAIGALVLVGALAAPLARSEPTQSPRVETAPAKPRAARLLDRVAILGASVSHGFGNKTPLSAVFQFALGGNHAPGKTASESTVFDFTEGNLYIDPQGLTERAVDRCIESRATLVVGVDLLFWFGYGIAIDGKDDLERRTKRLAAGLEALERLQCPLVLGDLPDVRTSTSRLLPPTALPLPETLPKLNEQIRAWAKAHANVTIVPLAQWVADLQAGTWVVPPPAGSNAKPEPLPAAAALLSDGLHPTDLGAHALAHELIRAIRASRGSPADALAFDGYAEARTRGLWPVPARTTTPPRKP